MQGPDELRRSVLPRRSISIAVAAVLLLFSLAGTSASASAPSAQVAEDGEFFRRGPWQFFPGGEFVNELVQPEPGERSRLLGARRPAGAAGWAG